MTVGRPDIAAKIAETTDLTTAQAADALAAWERIVSEALGRGESVRLPGFLTIDVVDRAARTGRNPQTGEPLEIAASRVPRFKAGSTLKVAARGA